MIVACLLKRQTVRGGPIDMHSRRPQFNLFRAAQIGHYPWFLKRILRPPPLSRFRHDPLGVLTSFRWAAQSSAMLLPRALLACSRRGVLQNYLTFPPTLESSFPGTGE